MIEITFICNKCGKKETKVEPVIKRGYVPNGWRSLSVEIKSTLVGSRKRKEYHLCKECSEQAGLPQYQHNFKESDADKLMNILYGIVEEVVQEASTV